MTAVEDAARRTVVPNVAVTGLRNVVVSVALVVGSLVAGVLLDIAVPDVFVVSLFLVVVSMPVAALAGTARRQRSIADDGRPHVASTPVV